QQPPKDIHGNHDPPHPGANKDQAAIAQPQQDCPVDLTASSSAYPYLFPLLIGLVTFSDSTSSMIICIIAREIEGVKGRSIRGAANARFLPPVDRSPVVRLRPLL